MQQIFGGPGGEVIRLSVARRLLIALVERRLLDARSNSWGMRWITSAGSKEAGLHRRAALAAFSRAGVLASLVAAVLALTTSGATTPHAGMESPAPDALSAVVPGGQLGQYRHGTYPSHGNHTHIGV